MWMLMSMRPSTWKFVHERMFFSNVRQGNKISKVFELLVVFAPLFNLLETVFLAVIHQVPLGNKLLFLLNINLKILNPALFNPLLPYSRTIHILLKWFCVYDHHSYTMQAQCQIFHLVRNKALIMIKIYLVHIAVKCYPTGPI